jgi:hypothetical protein
MSFHSVTNKFSGRHPRARVFRKRTVQREGGELPLQLGTVPCQFNINSWTFPQTYDSQEPPSPGAVHPPSNSSREQRSHASQKIWNSLRQIKSTNNGPQGRSAGRRVFLLFGPANCSTLVYALTIVQTAYSHLRLLQVVEVGVPRTIPLVFLDARYDALLRDVAHDMTIGASGK